MVLEKIWGENVLELQLQFGRTVLFIILLFSASQSIILGIYIFIKSNRKAVVYWYLINQALLFICTVFYIFEHIAPTVQIRWVIICIEYMAVCYFGVVSYMFARTYRGLKRLSIYKYIMIFIPSTLLYIGVITNPLHHKIYSNLTVESELYGELYWVIIVVSGIYIMGAVFHFVMESSRRLVYRKNRIACLTNALLIPLIVYSIYIFKFNSFDFAVVLAVTPFSLTLVTIAVLKYQFLDILPYILIKSVDFIDDGFLVINRIGDIEDYNELFFSKLIDINKCKKVKDVIYELEKIVGNQQELEVIRHFTSMEENRRIEGEIIFKHLDRELIFHYATKAIYNRYEMWIATIITFHDITEMRMLYEALEYKKTELELAKSKLEEHAKVVQMLTVENEHNRLTSEIHDIIGHSMAELLVLYEKCNLVLSREESDDHKIEKAIDETSERARKGLIQIRQSVSKLKKMGERI